ncbi:IS21 family transposase [Cellulosimicrobium arenosum]|uniref:IS21 family transposase n=1 Tax=Cellulosimicrobium arenosum TaxID=2708133 RepID=UPI003BA9D67D
MELFEEIRVDHRREGLSIRELAERHGVHRRTVRQALASPMPPPRKEYAPRGRPAIDRYRDVIDAWLTGDRDVPAKQRHTARRVWQRLVAEHGAQVSEVTVSRYVAARRRELGLDKVEVFVPQAHEAGAEAEVDFGEFHVRLRGQDLKVWMFAMRLSASGRAFHYAFTNQAQEAFLEGHVRALAHFGGVPARIRYDNLKPAVVRIRRGRDRVENDRFAALRSHYGFASFFCVPGKDGAHEKGGIEGEIGRFRRHLVPVPHVATLGELNELVAAGDLADDARVVTGHKATIGVEFTAERVMLAPLSGEAFDAATILSAKVDSRARVCVRQAYYSVPIRYVARRLTVRLGATSVEVLDGAKSVARHERATAKYVDVLDLDHYLEILARKPGALPGATALAQAKAAGLFSGTHQDYWDAARTKRGDGPGTRDLIEVLLAHRTLPRAALIAAMRTAVTSGVLEAASVIIDARRGAEPPVAPVIAIDALARYDRQPPTLDGYDALLTGNDR